MGNSRSLVSYTLSSQYELKRGHLVSAAPMSSRRFLPRIVLLKMKEAKFVLGTPPRQMRSRYLSVNASQGAMHLSDGGFWMAVAHCSVASQEFPHMLTAPLHHGCAAMNSTVS